VAVVAIVHVWNSLEALGQACTNLVLSCEPVTSRTGAARHVEHAIIREVLHDVVEVMAIERVQESFQNLYSRRLCHRVSTREAGVAMKLQSERTVVTDSRLAGGACQYHVPFP
jgi:hypothetical protein